MSTGTLRVAHRGGEPAPQNTLGAFSRALTLPYVDAVELDVQQSRDGQLIVLHDNEVDKLTDGSGNVLDLDFAALRELNAAARYPGGWPWAEQIPTLNEVLSLLRGKKRLFIEIKFSKRDGFYDRYPGIAENVVEEVRALEMVNQVQVMSFDWMILPTLQSMEPSLETGMIISEDSWRRGVESSVDSLIEQAITLGTHWLNLEAKLWTPEIQAAADKHHFKVGLWTVNDLDAMKHFLQGGVQAITSDRIELFQKL